MGIVRGKNDKIDARRIAKYAEEKQKDLEPSRPLNKTIVELKELLGLRKRLVRENVGYKGTISERKFMKDLKKDDLHIKILKDKIKSNDKIIKKIELEMFKLIASDKEMSKNYEFLISIKGIGMVNATMTIAYTENFVAFGNARSYAVYVGVVPFDYSSGTSIRGRKRVSPLANKELKQELTQAARSAINHSPEMREYAQRLNDKNKVYGIILNNVKFKLITRMFSVVKRQENYVENYDNNYKKTA